MTELTSELLEIKTALVRLEGSIHTLNVEMRSGDRNADSSVKLLAQVVDNQTHTMSEHRAELKEALKEFRIAIDSVKDLAAKQASAVRTDLERQLYNHSNDDFPHKPLGDRISALEHMSTKIKVYGSIITLIGWSGVAAIVKFIGN